MPSAAQVYDVCGDLYPDSDERAVILSAIEKYIGRPSAGKHWNTWKDEGGKKHKGSAISDLEKARRDPAAWGVSAKCVPGRMRPSRPVRRAQEPASLTPLLVPAALAVGAAPAGAVQHSAMADPAIEPAIAAAPARSPHAMDTGPEAEPIGEAIAAVPSGDGAFDDLQDGATLLKRCEELEQEVERARLSKAKQQADIKAAKKQAKDAAKNQAKEPTKKPDATAKKAPDGAKPLHESSAGKSNTKKRKAEDEPDEEVS